MSLILLNLPAPEPSQAPATQVRPRAGAATHSASRGRRAAGWQATASGPNDLARQDLETTRDRSRLASRNSPYGGNAIDSMVANLIGTGIKPLSQHPSPKIREAIHTAWRRWTDSADFDGRTDFYGLQALATRTMVEAGEVLVRMRFGAVPGTPFQVELLEPDHLPVYMIRLAGGDVPDGGRVVCGVEIDTDGRRRAYHLLRGHPNESHSYGFTGATETVRVPAEEMLHVFHSLRPKEVRGTPWLGRVLWKLYQLDTYDDAELTRKQIAASITGFIMGSPQEGAPLLDVQPGMGTAADQVAQVEPGTLVDLAPGETVDIHEAADVGGMYEKYMQQQLRAIAAGCGVTYEQLTGDLTGVNYSSIRAGLLEFRRRCEQRQHQTFVYQFCRPIFNEWMRWAVFSGELALPNYLRDRAAYHEVKWVTPGWAWVDPLKDANAAIQQIKFGLTSRATVVNENGEDIEQIDKENAQDQQRVKRLGLHYGDPPPQEMARKAAAETLNLEGNAALGGIQ
jgi:lambda family phage portal protein